MREYFTETAILYKASDSNKFAELAMTESYEIKGMMQFRKNRRINKKGEEITTKGRFFTETFIDIDDKIELDGVTYTAVSYEAVKDLSGKLLYYRVEVA